jgi:predicted transcriptional regulator
MSQRTLTAHVPAALAKQVDALAQRLHRSKDWILKAALEQYLAPTRPEQSRLELAVETLVEVVEPHAEPEVDEGRWAAEAF